MPDTTTAAPDKADKPAATISYVAGVKATLAGGAAFRAGKDVSACPFDAASDDVAVRFNAHHWVRGFTVAATDS